MNCQSFKNIAAELAREQLLDGAQKEEGLQHAVSCEICSARLFDEQMLTTLLRAERAIGLHKSGASDRLEVNLRNAFRQHAAQDKAGRTSFLKTPAPIFSRQSFPRGSALFAAAALVLLAFALITARALLSPVKPSELTMNSSPTIGHVAVPPAIKAERANKAMIDAEKTEPARITPVRVARRVSSHKTQMIARRPVAPIVKTYETTVNGREMSAVDQPGEDGSGGSEVATDFFSLGEGAQQPPLDSGQVVRVKVPRSTLATFGLPVNMERENESVKADILLGSDGLARAIRFVR